MHLQNSLKRISELFSIFITQVKSQKALGLTDLNKLSENVLVPLFREIYNFNHIEKLEAYHENFPAIDLGDDFARVAIQITATPSSEKVKKTLKGFIEHRLFERYDRLIIYIISEKQTLYSGKGFDEIIEDRFSFNTESDIQDWTDLLGEIKNFQLAKTRKVESILEQNFGESDIGIFGSVELEPKENVSLNFIDVTFPSILYIADISIERQEVIANSKHYKIQLNSNSDTRKIVRAALEQLGFGTDVDFDWVCHENKIITFHDLDDKSQPLNHVIDIGTLTPMNSQEFFEIDEDYERLFIQLLRCCLQQMLMLKSVIWHKKEKLFIFVPTGDEDIRKEKWVGERSSERDVFVKKWRKDEPDKVDFCKHLAFSAQFRRVSDNWYLIVKPDWHFSFDGYKRHFKSDDKVAWLKRQERNPHILNHLRFITHFLSYKEPPGLFDETYNYPFLTFGELQTFSNSPPLDDKLWLGHEEKEVREKLDPNQMPLFTEDI